MLYFIKVCQLVSGCKSILNLVVNIIVVYKFLQSMKFHTFMFSTQQFGIKAEAAGDCSLRRSCIVRDCEACGLGTTLS